MDQLCIWCWLQGGKYYEEAHQTQPTNRKKNPKGGVSMLNLFFTFSITIWSPSSQHYNMKDCISNQKQWFCQCWLMVYWFDFMLCLFPLKWHQDLLLLLLLPYSKNLNDPSCCWDFRRHSGSDWSDLINWSPESGASRASRVRGECNNSFAPIYRGEKIQLVRNNSPRRWQCPLSGILAETCLHG